MTLERVAGHPVGRPYGLTRFLGQRDFSQLSFGQTGKPYPKILESAKVTFDLRPALFVCSRILDHYGIAPTERRWDERRRLRV
jgi:hypothetical protein